MSALPQSILTVSALSIREEESVTLGCSSKEKEPPTKCLIYSFKKEKEQNNIAYECQATFTGSELLKRTGGIAEVKVRCFYIANGRVKDEPAPHSDIVSITVGRGE